MNPNRSMRALLGNLGVGLVLLLIALFLLRLHLSESWWNAPPLMPQWWAALAALLVYAVACFALWWRTRQRDDDAGDSSEPPILVVWASQTGFAQQLAQRTAAQLRAAGHKIRLRAIDQVDAALLDSSRQALFVASTTGEGDPPDHALAFLSRVMPQPLKLAQLQYAVLALGDKTYDQYCAFGHQLDDWLRAQGAQPLFDTVEVDNADAEALRHWQQLLGQLGGSTADATDWSAPAYQSWLLRRREMLNPGSIGGKVFHLQLQPADGKLPTWQAGDIAEIGPRQSAPAVTHWLQTHGFDAAAVLADGRLLRDALAVSHLPDSCDTRDADALAANLTPLPHREYSIASMPSDGSLQLMLRRQLRPDGTPGLASGWLCDYTAIGDSIDLRLRSNSNFHPPRNDAPLILIGNGTGIAGLRAHLRARIDAGARRNWLLFGERNAAHDFHFGDELRQWQREGGIERLDAVFSRDPGQFHYVQDALAAHSTVLQQWLEDGATLLVCGSLQGMAPAVDKVIIDTIGAEAHQALRIAGRYRRDVY
ncbi:MULTISPECIES: sulfite reductase flavoprotein subunit alpha [Stenotrophomonas]|uniref:sulfite reductase subunit alpha n=1 Tax=Stenotrophomonas TaxID=40323 RepID=UPI0007701730|nr:MULTISPECIES: sulfite reductase flavoprotein subunit alpha [Stenotrophomonas]AMJ57315.1 sulfite reductase subunit alpha [Stenotrophomonas sp. KCTC 12332]